MGTVNAWGLTMGVGGWVGVSNGEKGVTVTEQQ